jgi:hypothetical protein
MSNSPKLRPFTRRVSTHGGGVRRKLRRMTYWKTLFVSAIAAVACGSSNVAIPTCSGNQVCAESSHGPACLQNCALMDASVCANGMVCTHSPGCCSDCYPPILFVCCPPSGC